MDGEISIPGFNLIRKDHNRAGGGVVLYIRDNLSSIWIGMTWCLIVLRCCVLKLLAPLASRFLSAHGIGLRIQT
jgi:hypothetical protein